MKYINYSVSGNGDLQVSEDLRCGINSLLRDAYVAIEEDVHSEKAGVYNNLKEAKNFLKFYKEHEEDFISLGYFLRDHAGAYDKMRAPYNWAHLHPVVYCLLNFGCKTMPYRFRLLELTGRYEWASLALDDEEICRFVTANFMVYAHMKEQFFDEHGRAQSILEFMYGQLHRLNKQKQFEAGYQWSLMGLLYQYLYADYFGF